MAGKLFRVVKVKTNALGPPLSDDELWQVLETADLDLLTRAELVRLVWLLYGDVALSAKKPGETAHAEVTPT